MARKVHIKDVAARAGVSVTTVSHVLNHVPGKRVSSETRQRVFSAAEELRYRPNLLARGLRTQRTHVIGFISDRVVTTPFAGRMVVGAQDAAARAGSLLMLLSSDGDADLEEREVDALLERQVDGIVYAAFYHRVLIPPAGLRRAPAVLLDARSAAGDLSSVVPDEVGGARAAVTELLEAGHRRIGFVNNEEDVPARDLRATGVQQALEAYGLSIHESLVVAHAHPSAAGGFHGATALLERDRRPTALFCATDRMAMGAYQAAQELGLRIPTDLSVVGFDDQVLVSDSLRPTLTTVALPHYEMGRWAVDTLLGQIESPTTAGVQHAQLPCPLVPRASVAPPDLGGGRQTS